MIKYEDKIVGNHLKLYFYYINKEQKLIVMYLEIISTEIKTIITVSDCQSRVETGWEDCVRII